MKKILLLFLTMATQSIAQEKRSMLYAKLHDEVGVITNAHIINVNTKQGTYSNEQGKFRVLAKPNDTLQISFIGYETKMVKVTATHFGLQTNNIKLNKTSIELDEVELKKNNLLGYLSTDSRHIKPQKEINAKSLGLPNAGLRKLTPAERRLYTATGGRPLKIRNLGFLVSGDYIINSISGRLKKLRKQKVIEDTEKRIKNIHNAYGVYIQQELKILPDHVNRFIYFVDEAPDFKATLITNKILMAQFLQTKAKDFKKLNPKNYELIK